MIAAGLAGLAAGVAASSMNNYFADEAAYKSYNRQRILMNEQNKMNLANAYGQTSRQVQGARMAGFNPAMFMNGGTSPAPTVSQGNADMAQRFPIDLDSAMTFAQLLKTEADIDNVNADTELKKTQNPNVKADTDLKVAQTLYQDASTEVQKQKAQEIKNLNDQYADRNNMLKTTGPAMMDQLRTGLKEKGLWDKMLPKTRQTIDDIADGNYELSVGALAALSDVIKTQSDLSDADRKFAENGLRSAVIYGQLSDKNVMDALAKKDYYEAELKRVGKDKMLADIAKVRAEIAKIGEAAYTDEQGNKHEATGEMAILDLEKRYKQMLNKSFEHGDLDYLRSEGKWGELLEKLAIDAVKDSSPGVINTVVSKFTRSVPTPVTKVNVNLNGKGVGNFKYDKK